MDDERILRVLRMMAVERAIGELHSILSTYWDDREQYREARDYVAGVTVKLRDIAGA